MAWPVYSSVLLRQSSSASVSTNLVPAGYRWVLRDIDARFAGAGAGAGLLVAVGAVQLVAFITASTGDPSFAWRGRQVMVTGESASFTPFAAAGTWHISASGYELTLP
jgi:hypothetical protein